MICLKLKENALHTLHHAVEQMYAVSMTDTDDYSVDDESGLYEEFEEKETLCPSLGECLQPQPYTI